MHCAPWHHSIAAPVICTSDVNFRFSSITTIQLKNCGKGNVIDLDSCLNTLKKEITLNWSVCILDNFLIKEKNSNLIFRFENLFLFVFSLMKFFVKMLWGLNFLVKYSFILFSFCPKWFPKWTGNSSLSSGKSKVLWTWASKIWPCVHAKSGRCGRQIPDNYQRALYRKRGHDSRGRKCQIWLYSSQS